QVSTCCSWVAPGCSGCWSAAAVGTRKSPVSTLTKATRSCRRRPARRVQNRRRDLYGDISGAPFRLQISSSRAGAMVGLDRGGSGSGGGAAVESRAAAPPPLRTGPTGPALARCGTPSGRRRRVSAARCSRCRTPAGPWAGRRSSLGPPPRPRSGQVLQVLHSHVAELHQVGVAVVLQPDVAAVELPQVRGRVAFPGGLLAR